MTAPYEAVVTSTLVHSANPTTRVLAVAMSLPVAGVKAVRQGTFGGRLAVGCAGR